MTFDLSPLPTALIDRAVQTALLEDLGSTGDLTSTYTIPEDAVLTASVVSRQAGCIAGIDFLAAVTAELSDKVTINLQVRDGAAITAGTVVAKLQGPARRY